MFSYLDISKVGEVYNQVLPKKKKLKNGFRKVEKKNGQVSYLNSNNIFVKSVDAFEFV